MNAVDVEGKAEGIESGLIALLGRHSKLPVTYAGGVGSYEDIEAVRAFGLNKVDITIGSALDLFGGRLEFARVLEMTDR